MGKYREKNRGSRKKMEKEKMWIYGKVIELLGMAFGGIINQGLSLTEQLGCFLGP